MCHGKVRWSTVKGTIVGGARNLEGGERSILGVEISYGFSAIVTPLVRSFVIGVSCQR